MSRVDYSSQIKQIALRHGFERCGIAPARPIDRADYLRQWLAAGMAGTMGYLHRHFESRVDVRGWMPSARSVIVVAMNYRQPEIAAPEDEARGRVAMYAWGADYHLVIQERLEQMVAAMRSEIAETFEARVCVDTSAILERELAAMAGIGWIGKNTMVLHQSLGSYFFLGEIVTDLELTPDRPEPDHCGSCTRCLDACPTEAFPAPYRMDARKCISYLTIEHRNAIEPRLAAKMGEWVFGCDICQQVCPFNREAPTMGEPRFAGTADTAHPRLGPISDWTPEEYAEFVGGRAVDRARLDMWKRNAAIVGANLGSDAQADRSRS